MSASGHLVEQTNWLATAPPAAVANVLGVPVSFVGCPAAYTEAIIGRLAQRGLALKAPGDPLVELVWCADVGALAISDGDTLVVVVLTDLSVDAYARALAAGACGVVHVDASSDMTVDAIEAAVHGAVVLPRHVAHALAGEMTRDQPSSDLSKSDEALLRSISQGQAVADIATDRFFSERTVRRHLQGVYLKLGVQNRAEAIAAATRLGLNS